MSSMRQLEVFLLLFLLHQVSGSEEADLLFREEGSVIELGYCFGVDYIVVYRSGPEGQQLLGNSSAQNLTLTLPADLYDRIRINSDQRLLGLQISDLTHTDSGLYKRECWQDGKQVSQQIQQVWVCDEEVMSTEIPESKEGRGTMLLCNSTSIGQAGVSVRWYREKYPSYKTTLILDSSKSLDLMLEELQGVMEVRENGALLLLDDSVLEDNHHFYCTVSRGEQCLSFQNMFLPDRSESREVFLFRGERVELKCPSEGENQQWETPLGRLDGNSAKNSYMHISFGDQSEDFSLVIPEASDDHSGDYSCISSKLEVQYSLVLCPKKESQRVVFTEGQNVSLHCDVGEQSSQRVLWYRLHPTGEHQLMYDSDDNNVDMPADLIGRVTLSGNNSLLSISHLKQRDCGVYWCVVFGGSVFLEDVEYKEDYDEDHTTVDDISDSNYWQDPQGCIFKQETVLASNTTPCFDPTSRKPPPADPTPAPHMTPVIVGGVVLVLVVVVAAAIIAVIVMKKRRQGSRVVNNKVKTTEREREEEPECAESLTQSDKNGP